MADEGTLYGSTLIIEYLEARSPGHPLRPADPFTAARVRQLLRCVELHRGLVARNLCPEAFVGGKISDATRGKIGQQLEISVAAFAQPAKFGPYLADVAIAVRLPLVSSASQHIHGGRDCLADLPVRDDLKKTHRMLQRMRT